MALYRDKILTDKELAQIRRRCEAATPGPWVSYVEGRDHSSGSSFIMTGKGELRGEDIELCGATEEDQDFIAHARQDIPMLLDEIGRLRKQFSVDWITTKILEFMAILYEGYKKISLTSERLIYADDLVTAMGWIVSLRRGVSCDEVVKDILASEISKPFRGYPRQGEWEDKKAEALAQLKEAVKKRIRD